MESFRKFKNRILTKDFLKTVLNSIDEAISIIDVKDFSITQICR